MSEQVTTAEPGPVPTGAAQVQAEFDKAADRYDVMVALNPGYHQHLRMAAAALADRLPRTTAGAAPLIADLGCGSGASTRALADVAPQARIVGVDASSGMLDQARAKSWSERVSFTQGFAEDLGARRAAWGIDQPLDGLFAAYLFRNVRARDEVARSAFEALRPGGALVIQEYCVAGSRSAVARWSAVCWSVVIPLSIVTRAHPSIYRYLWRSVLRNDSVQTLADRFSRAGFVDVEVRTVHGWQRGILHTIRARKPE